MATEHIIQSVTKKAYNDLSTKQYYVVKLVSGTTANLVDVCSAQGERSFGVLQNDPEQNEAANVAVLGFCKAITHDTSNIWAGKLLTTDANGKLEGASSGDYVCAIAQGTASANDDVIEVELVRPFIALA